MGMLWCALLIYEDPVNNKASWAKIDCILNACSQLFVRLFFIVIVFELSADSSFGGETANCRIQLKDWMLKEGLIKPGQID